MGKKKIQRGASLGYWWRQIEKTSINDYYENKIVYKRLFNYRVKKGLGLRENWIMHE